MTRPRLLMMAQPPSAVRDEMETVVRRNGLDARLGGAMFEAENWHQTLSDRYEDTPAIRAAMRRAGARVSAQACTLSLNRIRGEGQQGSIHWAFRAAGKPQGFDALLAAVRTALAVEHLGTGSGHTPHVTISYHAPDRLGSIAVNPICWTIAEILLVVGAGTSYHYHVIDGWPLRPAAPEPSKQQLSLFETTPQCVVS
nr:hypothetical protein [uncultured Roseateles sp.]